MTNIIALTTNEIEEVAGGPFFVPALIIGFKAGLAASGGSATAALYAGIAGGAVAGAVAALINND